MTDATLTERVLVPVANAEDARTTARVLRPYSPHRVIAIHVIETTGGAPDKAGVEQRQEHAERIFAAVESAFENTGIAVETDLRYGTNVAGTIIEAATDHDVSAVVFSPRKGGRWVRLLTGDVALSLVTESDRPVIVLPGEGNELASDGGPRGENESADAGHAVGTDVDESDAVDGTDGGREIA